MTSRFMTDPHAMPGDAEAVGVTRPDWWRTRKLARMWASAPRFQRPGWVALAEATSLDTADPDESGVSRLIVNMLHGVRDRLVRDANNYEQQSRP